MWSSTVREVSPTTTRPVWWARRRSTLWRRATFREWKPLKESAGRAKTSGPMSMRCFGINPPAGNTERIRAAGEVARAQAPMRSSPRHAENVADDDTKQPHNAVFFLESASLAAAAVLAARRTAAAAAAPNLTPKRTMETRDEPDLGSNARKKTAAAPTRRPPHLYKQQTWSRRTRALNTVRAPATRRPMRFRGQFRQAPRCEPYTTTKCYSNVC